jgi:hypothetical protein
MDPRTFLGDKFLGHDGRIISYDEAFGKAEKIGILFSGELFLISFIGKTKPYCYLF